MKVGLIDVDRTGFPNLALMKLSAWHKARGDSVELLKYAKPVDHLYASCIFSWNAPKAHALTKIGAEIGGSG